MVDVRRTGTDTSVSGSRCPSEVAGGEAVRSGSRLVVVVVGAALALAACTDPAPQPDRPGTVVVAVASPFTSLNGGTAQGRAPGSTLVRGLAQSGFVSLAEDGTAVLVPPVGHEASASAAPPTA